MDIRTWTWLQILLVAAGYWLVFALAWWFRTTRPSGQARARASAPTEFSPGSQPGEFVVTHTVVVNVPAVGAVIFGPPLLLIVLRALL
jgi:hypothetical protein